MTIELLGTISHGFSADDRREYSPGLHDLDDDLARHFLSIKISPNGQRVARLPQESNSLVKQGTVTKVR